MKFFSYKKVYFLSLSLIALLLTSCFIPKEKKNDDVGQLLGTDSVVGSWTTPVDNDTSLYYRIAADNTVKYCKHDSKDKKITYTESTWSGNTIQWSADSFSLIGSTSGKLNELFEGSFTTYSSTDAWPSSCDDPFVDTWGYTSSDTNEKLYYKIAADKTVQFCNLKSGTKVSDAQGNLSGSNIVWTDSLSSSLSFYESQLIETFEGTTTVYSSTDWPTACDTDIFSKIWKTTSTDASIYYDIKTNGSVDSCKVPQSGATTFTASAGSFSNYKITWTSSDLSSSVLVKDGTLIETYNNVTSVYTSESSLPATCL